MKKWFSKKEKTKDQSLGGLSRSKKAKEEKPKVKRQISFSRKKATRIASITLFSIIGLSLIFNVIFFSKYQVIRDSAYASEQRIDEQLQRVQESQLLDSQAAVVFAEEFLTRYFRIVEDKEKRSERISRLQEYFVAGFDVQSLEEDGDFKGERAVKSITFLEHERISQDKARLHFIVTYEITEIEIVEETVTKTVKEKDDDGKEKKKKVEEVVEKEEPRTVTSTVEIAVPITTDGQGFAVYDYPNLKQRDLKTSIQFQPAELSGDDITPTEREQLNEFLENFFTSYGLSDEKLAFMANLDRGLTNQDLEYLNIRQAVRNDNEFTVIVDVFYRNSETTLTSKYAYHLIVERERNSFYVTNID